MNGTLNLTAEQLLSSRTTSEWLKRALQSALNRDPIDAANDARLLAEVLQCRAEEVLSDAISKLAKDPSQ